MYSVTTACASTSATVVRRLASCGSCTHLRHTRRAWRGGLSSVPTRTWELTTSPRAWIQNSVNAHCRALATNAIDPQKNNNKNKKQNKAVKKKRSDISASATAGRIALQETSKSKSTTQKTRICSGCGTAVLYGQGKEEYGGQIFSTGTAAVDSTASKKAAKKARFFDFGDPKNPSNFLCQRCKQLKGNDIWSAYDAIRDVDASVFQAQLKHIVGRRKFGMCIVTADATDPEHSAPKHLRRSIGRLPVILVLTKADLVPRLDKRRDVRHLANKIKSITGNKFIETFRVSAVTGAGIFDLAEYLLHNIGGRDVFVVGAANVGKSTLVQRLAQEITPNIYLKDIRTAAKRKKKMTDELHVTASHLPGTTLQAVRVPCFPSTRHALWDTPGMIQTKAIQYSLFPPHLMEPLARAERIGLVDSFRVRAGQSILIEAAWMDEFEEGLDDDDDHDDIYAGDYIEKDVAEGTPKMNTSCVLGRLDIVDIPHGQTGRGRSILVRPFLHPSLRVRVVTTNDQVPEHAKIPQHYIRRIESRMGKKFPEESATSHPLVAFTTSQNPEGLIEPTEKDRNHDGRVYMDISFASLGWLAIAMHNEDSTFTIKPWCVKGSVFSKRRGLYPMNLSEDDVIDSQKEMLEEAAYLKTDEARRRLGQAAKEGTKMSGASREEHDEGRFESEIWLDSDDEWY